MRAEVEQAYDEGGDVRPGGSRLKSYEEMKRRVVGRVSTPDGGTAMAVMTPDGEVRYVNEEPTPMSKWELYRGARRKTDPEVLEAEAIERSFDAGGEGGRIEVYSGGAMEWVPNGPGGVPQPTTGDVFYDPIAEEQQEMERSAKMQKILNQLGESAPRDRFSLEKLKKMRQIYSGMEPRKFARGGVVKKFQAGGLAAVNLDEDEEEGGFFDVSQATGVDEILASVTPSPAPDLQKMARMNRDTALQQLRAGQSEFEQRQARQQKQAEQDRWFALAQGMLAPTQTGGFGENIGMAAGALREQSAQQALIEEKQALQHQKFAEREHEIASDYYDALENLSGFKSTSRARVVGTQTVIAPDQLQAVKDGTIKEADAERNIISIIMQPDGTTISRVERDAATGEPYRIVDPGKVPAQAAAQKAATVTAGKAMENMIAQAKMGVEAIPSVNRLQRAYGLLTTLREDTSGLSEKIREVAQWAGISEVIDDNTTLSVLHGMFGRQVLSDIRVLTGNKTDYEFKKVSDMNAILGKDTEANLGLLDEQMNVLDEIITRGEYAAQELTEGPGTEEKSFWQDQYLRFRKQQAEAAMEYDAATRTAPPLKEEQLIKLFQGAADNPDEQAYLIEAFEEHYDLTDEVRLALRELGANL